MASKPSATPPAPGRFGDPSMTFVQDPRANLKLAGVFKMMRMDGSQPNPLANKSADYLASEAFMEISDDGNKKLYDMLPNDLPEDATEPSVDYQKVSYPSFDRVERTLHVFRPTAISGPIPAVIYIHGGAMVVSETSSKVYMRWCRSIAVHGVVAIAVDFRNAHTKEGHNPFPIGLNDCAAALRFIHANKSRFGISHITLQGESGGGNLSLATALKAKREGFLDEIAGIYACVPYISNAYGWSDERKIRELPSLYECDGYLLTSQGMAGMGKYYSPNDPTDPLAWPYYASPVDWEGMPPVVLSMDELDPLRDEGLALYKTMLSADIDVTAQVNLGVPHAASLIFRQLMPEVHNKATREIAAFAKSVRGEGASA